MDASSLRKNQSGSIVIYALVVMIVMVTISMTLVNIFVPKLRIVRDSARSVVAIYAADSAIEACLYEARHPLEAGLPFQRVADYWLLFTTPLTGHATFTIDELKPIAGTGTLTTDCRPLGTDRTGIDPDAVKDIFQIRITGGYDDAVRTFEVSTCPAAGCP